MPDNRKELIDRVVRTLVNRDKPVNKDNNDDNDNESTDRKTEETIMMQLEDEIRRHYRNQ